MDSAENSITPSKKNTNILQITSQKNEGTFPNTFHKAEINLIAKLYKSPFKKNYMLVSLIDKATKVLNKIPANQIEKHIQNTVHHDQASFIPEILMYQ